MRFAPPAPFSQVHIVELVEYLVCLEREILLDAENIKNMEIALMIWNWLCSTKRVLEEAHTSMLCPILENLPSPLMLL